MGLERGVQGNTLAQPKETATFKSIALAECGERPAAGLERGFVGGTDKLRGRFSM